MVLACKVIEAILVESRPALSPCYYYDDVFSELDTKRRKQLVSFLQSYQSFVTTTDADIVSKQIT